MELPSSAKQQLSVQATSKTEPMAVIKRKITVELMVAQFNGPSLITYTGATDLRFARREGGCKECTFLC